MPSIDVLRRKLDALDKTLIATLAKRMALIPQVAAYKKANGVKRYQPAREKAMIRSRRALAKQLGVQPDLVEDVMKRIIQDAHRIQKEILGK